MKTLRTDILELLAELPKQYNQHAAKMNTLENKELYNILQNAKTIIRGK